MFNTLLLLLNILLQNFGLFGVSFYPAPSIPWDLLAGNSVAMIINWNKYCYFKLRSTVKYETWAAGCGIDVFVLMLPFWNENSYLQNSFIQSCRTQTQTLYLYEMERREREQDAGETERESVCERGRMAARRGSISCKNDRWRKQTIWDKNRIKMIGLN